MGLFNKKNPNESAYIGGKKHFTDVIKNSGIGELLIWRQPEEDFNTTSTLIVMPGEEAIFIKGGGIEQVFSNGTYKLSTENYPFVSRLRNYFSGGISSFNCVVYFVRKAHSEEILWGTDSPIQVRDRVLGIATKLKARGAYKIQVDNPSKFLEKLIGNNVSFLQQDSIPKYFRSEFQSKIKSSIASAVTNSNIELLGIDARLDEFSNVIQPFLQEIFDDYGLRLVKFSVAACDIADDELRNKYDEYGIENLQKMRNAQSDKVVMGILGEDWGRQQAVNIMSNISNNPGAGSLATAGAGLGIGVAAGNTLGTISTQIFSAANTPQQTTQIQIEKIKQLKELLDIDAITQTEFDDKKKEILSKM